MNMTLQKYWREEGLNMAPLVGDKDVLNEHDLLFSKKVRGFLNVKIIRNSPYKALMEI